MTGELATAALLDELAGRRGIAVIDDVGEQTWAELADRTVALVAHLRSREVPAGASVVVLSVNRREVIEVELACLVGGWTCVPVNWHFDAHGVARVLDDVDAAAIVVDPVMMGLLDGARPPEELPIVLALDGGEDADERRAQVDDYDWSLERADRSAGRADPAAPPGGLVFSTSGTTGRSRGVRFVDAPLGTGDGDPAPGGPGHGLVSPVLRHHLPTLDAAAIPATGRTLLCGPHYHWAQWTFGVLPLLRGSTIVMHSRFVPRNVLAAIDRHQVTNLLLVPTQFVRLLRLDAAVRAGFDGGSLERVVHGAAPCSVDTKRAVIDWLGPIVTEYYGATESGVVTLATTEDWHAAPDSVGRVVPGRHVTIVADDGTVAAVGRDGIIHVRSDDGVLMEYVGAPAATTATRALPGHVTFGDIGRLDPDGRLYLSDRRSDMIVTGGVNVSSAEVEAVIAQHPDVADVGVYGVPDAAGGQVVRAAVIPARHLDEASGEVERFTADVLAFCRERLAPHQCPVAVEVRDHLPRTATGKLVKRRLRAPYWEPHIGPIRT